MTHKTHPKYPFQRVEQRRNLVDVKGNKERAAMEQASKPKISIGTFTVLPPKPDTLITTFTLALNKSITKRELLIKLFEVFGNDLNEEQTKSIFVHLVKPVPLQDLREKINKTFATDISK